MSRPATIANTKAPPRPGDGQPPEHATFLRNCWYAAAWSEEVQDKPFGLTLCGRQIVLVRARNGEAAALSGVCPHRFASLDKGVLLAGERLQCPYHGLEFALDGRCVANPHGHTPTSARLARYPLVERHSLLWVWMGEEDRVDDTLIPDFHLLEDRAHRTIRGRLQTSAHFELITDNLMDLSHVGYLHKEGLGSDAIKDGRHEVLQAGTTLQSNRWCPNGAAPPVWAALFGGYAKPVDHWLNMRWDAPSTMWLDVGVAPAGRPRTEGITVFGAHILTPETERSTHYLWAACRDFALDDDGLDVVLKTSIEHAFVDEDKPMLEDVQRNMGDRSFAEMRPVILSVDLGAVRARQVLEELRRGRRAQQPSAQIDAAAETVRELTA
ncbi:MAG TPA: aromatic ring-hydroxylating dioxygenase subunit alpha [Caulobacteraceae bacterium]|nr:aromatic ring-hydroxylating dioxygenase subunit alpha [Caulobacteraceae bacterium]